MELSKCNICNDYTCEQCKRVSALAEIFCTPRVNVFIRNGKVYYFHRNFLREYPCYNDFYFLLKRPDKMLKIKPSKEEKFSLGKMLCDLRLLPKLELRGGYLCFEYRGETILTLKLNR